MPRGENPNSRRNLKRPSTKEARERGFKGGISSGKSRRVMKSFVELDEMCTTDEERIAMLTMLKKRAMQGNIKAFEVYATYMGLKPTDKVNASIDAKVYQEVEEEIRMANEKQYEESCRKLQEAIRLRQEREKLI